MKELADLIICLLYSLILNINLTSEALQDDVPVQELRYMPAFGNHQNLPRLEKYGGAVSKDASDESKIWNLQFAGGMVSVDCLRCLCLKQSNCKPFGCEMRYALLKCGYFKITHDQWNDCGQLGSDWKNCTNDVMCSSLCVQNYMKRYAQYNNCWLKCEGYSRELAGGPNGCNNPRTIPFWNDVQKVPGCKGVE